MTLLMQAPTNWPAPTVAGRLMPSGHSYVIDANGQINARPVDVGMLLGLSFSSVQITNLTNATVPLSGSEKLEVIQGGIAKQVSAGDIGGGGGGSQLITTTVHITPTQMKSVTPTTIVAAPGVGKVIAGISVFIELKFNSVAYSGGDFTTNLYYGDASGPGSGLGNSIYTVTESSETLDVFTLSIFTRSQLENKPLVLASTGPYDAGDGDVYITISYVVMSLH